MIQTEGNKQPPRTPYDEVATAEIVKNEANKTSAATWQPEGFHLLTLGVEILVGYTAQRHNGDLYQVNPQQERDRLNGAERRKPTLESLAYKDVRTAIVEKTGIKPSTAGTTIANVFLNTLDTILVKKIENPKRKVGTDNTQSYTHSGKTSTVTRNVARGGSQF